MHWILTLTGTVSPGQGEYKIIHPGDKYKEAQTSVLERILFGTSELQSTLLFFAVALLFVHLLHLHASVLEPDFDLPLGQIQNPCHFEPAVPSKVHVKQKLLFQFQSLILGVGASLLSGGAGVDPICHWVI